ncbi:uncharacterized protein LOC127876820 isoform X2 [Dreissena polymorpha]|uniref:uncharacterized protein LOC127876820 isoform X2 n=1 Tax=Dreissena polymorpha TaxID=45954 RepID=UPI00226460CD|nr:uncharacterized protein LOC127876820 isoform X2 [Dreissena polymorpha]
MRAIAVLAFLYGFAAAIPAPGTGALEGYCDTSAHCAADECCVSFNQPRGRRTVVDHLDPNLMRFVHGSCQKKGTSGSRCYVQNLDTGFVGLYYDPVCADGYVCDGEGQFNFDKGEMGTCQLAVVKASSTLSQPCSSGADCSASECCVNEMRPIGKRALGMGYAHCQPMGVDGSGCLVHYGSGKPNGTVFQCPCSTGFTCHGNHMFDIPLGETGTCGV